MSVQELASILRRLQEQGGPTPGFSVEMARRSWYAHTDDFVMPASIKLRSERIGDVPADWLQRPGASAGRAVLFLHGGGYVCGSPRTHRPLTAELAKSFDGIVLCPDYRLAPEHPFPAAVEDAVRAYRHLLAAGVPAHAIALAGDSAGGGLAVGLLAALQQQGLALPGAVWAISPWSDLTHAGETIGRSAEIDPIVFDAALTASRDLYLAGAGHAHPFATTGAGAFVGGPPLLVQVGSREILLDDALRLARLAALDGAAVTLEVWPDMVHVWHLFARDLQEARDAVAQAAGWLNARLG